MDTRLMEEGGDLDERTAVFALGRRVHRDIARAVGERGAKVAPEARVLGCRSEGEGRAAQLLLQPGLQRIAP